MDIYKLIGEQLSNPKTLEMLGQSVKANPDQVQQLTKVGVPALLQALGRNASTPDGAQALAGALAQHEDDNVEDIAGFLKNVDTADASKMLGHIFAGKDAKVQTNLAKQTGLGTDQVSGVMSQLAPLLMGALAQQKKQQNIDASGIAGLIGGVMEKNTDSGMMNMVTKLLDSDKDGSIVDDVGKLFKGFFKK